MKFTAATALFGAIASATTVSWDAGYSDAGRSMNAVACSDGANGLITKYGYQTQGAIPRFPLIGGSSDIEGWNSAQCGQCYSVTYNGKTINILAIDHAGAGLNLSKEAMNQLTNNQADALGRVEANVQKVSVDQCGLTPKRHIEFNA